jgi:hypothetical protein
MTAPHRMFRALALAFFALAPLATARADDAASSFIATSNPSGAWAYGHTTTRGGLFAQFAAHGTDTNGLDYWQSGVGEAQVSHNNTGSGKLVGGTTYTPPGGLNLTPGANNEFSVVQWTAPANGTYTINAHFIPRVFQNQMISTEVAVLQGSAVLFDRWINFGSGINASAMTSTLTLTAGATISFVVGTADENNNLDVIGLDATIDLEGPPAGATGPVITLGGQRFAACTWQSAFESIAFDPVNRRLASRGKIRDLCGNIISDGPDENPGLCWDSKTGTYWQVTNDRTVRRWSAAGVLLDTVFVIPLTFTVPSSGPDTLESVRGIATDSTNVYIVDAGPNPGTLSSNEWFKFTRTGTPVKSSKATDLVANLDLDPDALVDDICYLPFSSPVFPGRFLIALEHSGIQIVDANGNFVAKFRWSAQGFAKHPLTALTGIAVDPATGNIYLANNDNSSAMVLTRIPAQGATSVVTGTAGSLNGALGVQLKSPTPGCDLPMWNAYGLLPTSSGNIFGLTYRSANNSMYMIDYGTGDLWRVDPRLGTGQRVGPTGITSVWGLTYDSDRDVFYFAEGNTPSHIVVVDPTSAAASSLPMPVGYPIGASTDIAWDASDKKIYAVDNSVNPARLLRIDRDTGAGTVVGNTGVHLSGIEYDAATNKLIASSSTRLAVFRIDPSTAVTDSISALKIGIGWEGLTVLPVPANSTPLAIEDPIESPTLALAAYPNPARAGATVAFSLRTRTEGSVAVYDIAGRRVRELKRGQMAPGPQHIEWDGRSDDGTVAASGVYFIRLESRELTSVARLTMIR